MTGHWNDQIVDRVIDLLGNLPSNTEPSASCETLSDPARARAMGFQIICQSHGSKPDSETTMPTSCSPPSRHGQGTRPFFGQLSERTREPYSCKANSWEGQRLTINCGLVPQSLATTSVNWPLGYSAGGGGDRLGFGSERPLLPPKSATR